MTGEVPKRWLASPKVQLVLFIFTVLYCFSPIDFIPDAIPLLGWMDDLGVFLAELLSFTTYLKYRRQETREKKEG